MVNNNYFRVGGSPPTCPTAGSTKCQDFCDYLPCPSSTSTSVWSPTTPSFAAAARAWAPSPATRPLAGAVWPHAARLGVKWDLRKVDHYECYDDFDWAGGLRNRGRLHGPLPGAPREMRESLKIIQQASMACPAAPGKTWRPSAWPKAQSQSGTALTTSSSAKKLPPPSKFPLASTTCG
jgi:NAD(P)H-quinone oxidoreductase subunit H